MKKFNWLMSGIALASLLLSNTALALTPPSHPSERLPLIRLYNPVINDHFYTSNRVEADTAVAVHGYRIEGEMGYVEKYQQSGTEFIFRMWNPTVRKHFYTTNSTEAQTAVASGYTLEGATGFMLANDPPIGDQSKVALWEGRVLVHRLYNSVQRKHFYTTDKTEANFLQGRGYVSEGQLGGGIYNSSVE